jgi:hypothetical protein
MRIMKMEFNPLSLFLKCSHLAVGGKENIQLSDMSNIGSLFYQKKYLHYFIIYQ